MKVSLLRFTFSPHISTVSTQLLRQQLTSLAETALCPQEKINEKKSKKVVYGSFAAYTLWMLGHKRLINSSWVAWERFCEAENAAPHSIRATVGDKTSESAAEA